MWTSSGLCYSVSHRRLLGSGSIGNLKVSRRWGEGVCRKEIFGGGPWRRKELCLQDALGNSHSFSKPHNPIELEGFMLRLLFNLLDMINCCFRLKALSPGFCDTMIYLLAFSRQHDSFLSIHSSGGKSQLLAKVGLLPPL